MAAATFLSKRNAVCGRRFSSVSAWSLCSRTADLQGTFSPEARKTRPGGKAAGYDKSQRACEPSDTSRDFLDSLCGRRPTRSPTVFCAVMDHRYNAAFNCAISKTIPHKWVDAVAEKASPALPTDCRYGLKLTASGLSNRYKGALPYRPPRMCAP